LIIKGRTEITGAPLVGFCVKDGSGMALTLGRAIRADSLTASRGRKA